ncbi:MAG: GTP 3',8-cyclase MoaA [Cyanobacteriota bacterium]
MQPPPHDRHGRPLGVLRLSLTARCNLACPYCLPDGSEPPGLLSQAQRLAVVEAAVTLGARRLRLTGGEPLLHPGLESLIAAAAPLRAPGSTVPPSRTSRSAPAPGSAPTPPSPPAGLDPFADGDGDQGLGLREISLTSNGALLTADRARSLRAAGLDRLTLRLDGASGEAVAAMAGLAGGGAAGEVLLAKVLAAIEHARTAGFDPAIGQLKLNAVIQHGRNDDQLLPLAALARERGVELRLIEFMDVGNRNGWRPEAVLSAAAMVERIRTRWPLEPLGRNRHGTASRWRYRDGAGHLALVASVSTPFCGDCDRLRVTADGLAYTCLFADPASGFDLRPWLQPGIAAGALREAIAGLWRARADRWSEERLEAWRQGAPPPVRHAEMAYLGG